ncbi:MAG: DUF445 domain-containing protein [Gammaproteobacteria bacterium RBG_16_57_12]|nr:MAG: DUF445 domain-containing protein [Gammaproteobacteria bacterium RBG_16_57_12]
MNHPYTLNYGLITNLCAVLLIVAGFVSPYGSQLLLNTGYFALSGALTNWLAVYMLFEKVPGLYGSGVIPTRFEEFKASIKDLIMTQFFTPQIIDRFIAQEEESSARLLNIDPILNSIDYDKLYQSLVDSVMASSFGSMLGLLGGAKTLESLRQPFTENLRRRLEEMTRSDTFTQALKASINTKRLAGDMIFTVEDIIDRRLAELTPQMVKEIVQQVIQQHLGWLVVWGGVFGGLIGLLVSLIP